MILVIDSDLYEITPPDLEGVVLDAGLAQALREIWLSRCIARWRTWMKQNPTADLPTTRAAMTHIVANFKFDRPGNDDDIILVEAFAIAKKVIEDKMAAQGLPTPKNLDEHVKALATSPEVLARARSVISAKLQINQRLNQGIAK